MTAAAAAATTTTTATTTTATATTTSGFCLTSLLSQIYSMLGRPMRVLGAVE